MINRAALYIQAIRGPVLLMTVGTLFVLHQSGLVSFARTWPLIIIVIGVMKLLERMALPPTGSIGMGPTGVGPTGVGPTGMGPTGMGAPGMRDPRL